VTFLAARPPVPRDRHAKPRRIVDRYATARGEDDLFYFLLCATNASPQDEDWRSRAKEELYSLDRYFDYLRYLEKSNWIELTPTGDSLTRWRGTVRHGKHAWPMEVILKDAYPEIPPACRIPELMHFTDRKVDDEVLGLRICDMHMERSYWWHEHCSLALYLKREVSYWVTSVVKDMETRGWLR
jgi:hypothetical protein